jgi:hypothetical protein
MGQGFALPAQENGNYFVKNVPGQANPNLCPAVSTTFTTKQLTEVFPGGIATTNLTPDTTTNRIPVSQLQTYVASLEQQGIVPVHKPKPDSRTKSLETDMDSLVADDSTFFGKVREEYCYYESRYTFSLKRFLQLATTLDNSNNDAARQMLNISTQLNQKLNNMLEVIAYITDSRVDKVNSNKDNINQSNRKINERLAQLKGQYGLLSRDNATIETQKEMVRYTKEKNDYTVNQITVFTALNALAIAAVFAIYRAAPGT